MKLSKLRNAIVYRATLPSIEAVEGHLQVDLPLYFQTPFIT